jgi:hypothetical protein
VSVTNLCSGQQARSNARGANRQQRTGVRSGENRAARRSRSAMPSSENRQGESLRTAFEVLISFLGEDSLTHRIARLEHELVGIRVAEIPHLLSRSLVDVQLLQSAFLARQHLGRLNDLIHASAIALALPHLLEPDEHLTRPSLAAGNDPSRPFDIESDRRVAEFKLSRWQGKDAMRKRQVFKDLVHLASDESGRSAELYVLGERPIRFLRTSKSRASWALDRSPREREIFRERFGSLERRISDFTAAEGSRVTIIDLEKALPDLFRHFDDLEGDDRSARSTE